MIDVLLFSDRNHIYHDPYSMTGFTATGLVRYCGPYRLATELRKAGYSCMVIENFSFMSFAQLCDIVKKYVGKNTKLIGLTTTFMAKRTKEIRREELSSYLPQYDILGRTPEEIDLLFYFIRSNYPNVKLALGGSRVRYDSKGPHTGEPKLNLFDFYFSGLSDRSIVELVKYLDHKTNELIVRKTRCEYEIERNYIVEKDYPYHGFRESSIDYSENDLIFPEETISMEIARGCIFKCSYCDFSDLLGKKFNDWTRSADSIRASFIRNYELYKTQNYWLVDDLINDSMEKVDFLCDIIQSLPFPVRWRSYARLDLFWKNKNMAQRLLDSGCDHVQMGIETFNRDAGKQVGKGLGEDRIIETLAHLKQVWGDKVNLFASFIVGLPGDKEENVRRVVDYVVSEESAIHNSRFYPLFIFDKQKSGLEKLGYNIHNMAITPDHWTKVDNTGIDSFQTAFKIAEQANNDTAKAIEHKMFGESRRFFDVFFSWPLRPMHSALDIQKYEHETLKNSNIRLSRMIDFLWDKETDKREEYLDKVMKHEYVFPTAKPRRVIPLKVA